MKLAVNVELSDEEIRSLAADVARRGIVFAAEYVDETLSRVFTPESAFTQGFFMAVGPVVEQFLQMMKRQQQNGPGGGGPGPGGPGLGAPRGRQPPGARQPAGPFGGPFGPPPGYGYTGPAPASGPGPSVVPFPSGAVLEHCMSIEETRQNEASWVCHKCAAVNGMQRTQCRSCEHTRCGAVVTPAPTHEPPPQVPGATGAMYPPNGPPDQPA